MAPEEPDAAGLYHADRSAARPPEGPAAAIDDGLVVPRATSPPDAPEASSDADPILHAFLEPVVKVSRPAEKRIASEDEIPLIWMSIHHRVLSNVIIQANAPLMQVRPYNRLEFVIYDLSVPHSSRPHHDRFVRKILFAVKRLNESICNFRQISDLFSQI